MQILRNRVGPELHFLWKMSIETSIRASFDRLVAEREAIESELNEELEWSRLEDRRASRIDAVRSGSIDDDDETLEELREWMVKKLLAFKKVFGPRLAALDFKNP